MTHSNRLALSSACLLALTSISHASGFRIPETSIKSVGLIAANVANAHGADASYYNPAAMAFNEDKAFMEGSLMLFHLGEFSYSGQLTDALGSRAISESSKVQNIPAGGFHYVSPTVNDWRFGLSVISPFGLTVEWDSPEASAYAEKFSLLTLELNPTFSYKLSDQLSIGGGLRAIYSDGEVKSSTTTPVNIARDLSGDSWDYGYNLALAYRPNDDISLAVTYRSKVDLSLEGDADLTFVAPIYSGFGSIDVVTPEVLTLAAAFDLSDNTTIEIVWDRTYWSDYKSLDFEYAVPLTGPAFTAFDAPKARNWQDTDAFRIGVTHALNDQWDLLFGYTRDEAATPDSTVSFELPDADANVFSVGAIYQYSDTMKIGAAMLASFREDRTINNAASSTPVLAGEFSSDPGLVTSVGFEMSF